MLKLYYAKNTCALAVHLALEWAQAPYEAELIDFQRQQQRDPAYLAINPKGRVPALVTERGVLTETPALLLYVAQEYPRAALAPLEDHFLLAKMNEINAYLCSTVHVNHAHKGRGARWADDEAAWESMKRKVAQNLTENFSLIEGSYLQGPWVLGERFSTSDIYLFTVARWLYANDIDVAQFPKVAALLQRMNAQPQVQKVMALHA
ncbi:glutathione S-transferase [Ramlibacter sp. AN1015]|uniref:glutathione S-transferase family protein n=1 Tax=Ramlibacter sp. AN1015 TaxID=3133428 RepID=UPI0030C015E3